MADTIKVLIVDDSALVRQILSDLLNKHPEIEVVGTAQDGTFVLKKIDTLRPDVITLDVEMRKKGGLEVLPEITQNYNIPVIMVSAHTERGAHSTLKALELGAIDFVTKPQAGNMQSLAEIGDTLTQKIIAVARLGNRRIKRSLQSTLQTPVPKPQVSSVPRHIKRLSNVDLIAIGASTGGTEAIKDVIINLPPEIPGIVIVQHMPAGFTKAFSQRLDGICKIEVKEAEDGDEIRRGRALIAPGSHHMEVMRVGAKMIVRLLATPPVNRHRPSVDVLFFSVAERIGNRCMAVILTGMGADGADGLRLVKDKGATTVAQDEESCVVFGMPKEAIKRGGASHVLPLDCIPDFLVRSVLSNGHRTMAVH